MPICETCNKEFDSRGITSHRKMHRDNFERVKSNEFLHFFA
jgi:hypothetical protein